MRIGGKVMTWLVLTRFGGIGAIIMDGFMALDTAFWLRASPRPVGRKVELIHRNAKGLVMPLEKVLVGLDDVLAARQVIGDRLHRTPMVRSTYLGEQTGVQL